MSSTVPLVQLCELLKCAMSKWDKNPDTLHISMGHSVGLKADRASEEELLNDLCSPLCIQENGALYH